MTTIFKKLALATSIALPLLASAGAAHAGLLISDSRYFPGSTAPRTSSVYDAQASIDAPASVSNAGAYQGGPRTGTGLVR
ncbi:MAG: hypothetical protein EKK40_00745 [Bradyrhizobiaceae bacterium]|nr:MAG: hypothetical protein EKK40_00745 [Bradyrhizobiaceae bacterium]